MQDSRHILRTTLFTLLLLLLATSPHTVSLYRKSHYYPIYTRINYIIFSSLGPQQHGCSLSLEVETVSASVLIKNGYSALFNHPVHPVCAECEGLTHCVTHRRNSSVMGHQTALSHWELRHEYKVKTAKVSHECLTPALSQHYGYL